MWARPPLCRFLAHSLRTGQSNRRHGQNSIQKNINVALNRRVARTLRLSVTRAPLEPHAISGWLFNSKFTYSRQGYMAKLSGLSFPGQVPLRPPNTHEDTSRRRTFRVGVGQLRLLRYVGNVGCAARRGDGHPSRGVEGPRTTSTGLTHRFP